MIKTYRLEFMSKKPSAVKSAWRDLIDAGLLSKNAGVLTGLFLAESPELSRVVDAYERDKVDLSLRMESSCQVAYEQSDIDSHELFKLYPPDVELEHSEQPQAQPCEECGRIIDRRVGSLTWAPDAVVPDCAVAMARSGDLILRDDLVQQLQGTMDLNGIELDAVANPIGSANWSVVLSAPVATRVGHRLGFCHSCGNAVKSEGLPEVDEAYSGSANRRLILSPDRPSLPCFRKDLAQWVIDASTGIGWEHFKPVGFQPTCETG